MLRKMLIFILCLFISGAVSGFGKAPVQTKEEKYKKQVLEWGTNKNIWVEMKSKEKLQGRISDIRDDVFVLQILEKDTIKDRAIRYDEVKKLSARDGGKAGKIAGITGLSILAGVGVVFLVTLAVWANN